MSFRREVLQAIGPLQHLYALYDAGIGKGEDAVLSHQATRYGRLLLLRGHFALHPPAGAALQTAYATSGYRKGLCETWGRANTLRWLAADASAYRTAWTRHVTFELGRAAKQLIAAPWQVHRWARLAGILVGAGYATANRSRIPRTPGNRTVAGPGSLT